MDQQSLQQRPIAQGDINNELAKAATTIHNIHGAFEQVISSQKDVFA